MKIINFIPLLVWSIGWGILAEWSEHLKEKDGRGKPTKEESRAWAEIYLFGCIFWLIIAILLLI